MKELPRKTNLRVNPPSEDSKESDLKEALPCGHQDHQPCAPHLATIEEEGP